MAGETTRFGAGQAIGSVELCDRVFMTDGDGEPDVFQLGPVLEELGPRIEELALHTLCREKAGGFTFTIQAEISYDGHKWDNVGDLFPAKSAEGYEISIFNTRSKLGRYMRFVVSGNDDEAPARARLAVTVYWRYAT